MKQDKGRFDFSLDQRQVVMIISGVIMVLMLSFLMGALFGKNVGASSNSAVELASADQAPTPPGAMDEVPAPESGDGAAVSGPGSAPDDSPISREAYIRELESMKIPTEVLSPDRGMGGDRESPMMTSLSPEAVGSPEADSAASPGSGANSAAPREEVYIPSGAYTIQLASLPDKAEADQVVAELKSRLYDAYILEVTIPGKGAFYRVRVGHYNSLDQAKKGLVIIQSREGKFFDAWITQ